MQAVSRLPRAVHLRGSSGDSPKSQGLDPLRSWEREKEWTAPRSSFPQAVTEHVHNQRSEAVPLCVLGHLPLPDLNLCMEVGELLHVVG